MFSFYYILRHPTLHGTRHHHTCAFGQASPLWRKQVIHLFNFYLQQSLTTHHDLEP